jgi:hypothetical protein
MRVLNEYERAVVSASADHRQKGPGLIILIR